MAAKIYEASDLIATDIAAYLDAHQNKSLLRFITCGSVDDGKSTLIGRLLHDTGSLPTDHLAGVTSSDGDVDLEDTSDFAVPPCEACGGVLKPDVVFFGENVPAARVERCFAAVDALRPEDGALLAAFSGEVTDKLAEVVARREPARAVFLDSGFVSDAARINMEQIFREISPSTDVKVL